MPSEREYLERRGWHRVSATKKGCMRVIRWSHPRYEGTVAQYWAIAEERRYQKALKSKAAQEKQA